jgi:hypothetical protein
MRIMVRLGALLSLLSVVFVVGFSVGAYVGVVAAAPVPAVSRVAAVPVLPANAAAPVAPSA